MSSLNKFKAQESFYHYVNQEWLNTNEIPQGYSRWSRFNELSDKTLEQIKYLLPRVKDSRLSKLQNLFENYNLEDNQKFINDLINEIDKIDNLSDLLNLYQTKLSLFGVNFLYDLVVESDMKNSKHNVLYLEPCSLTLPGRDYYLDNQFKSIRKEYLEFLNKFFKFHKLDLKPVDILNIETHLAKLQLAPEEKRNPDNIYFPQTNKTIIDLYKIPLDSYFNLVGKRNKNDIDKIICSNERYFENYLKYTKQDITILKSYLKFKTALRFSTVSQGELYQLIFNFFGKTLSGQKEPLPQWKRTINLINGTLGELLSKEYIDTHFSNESKQQVSEMISYFKEVLNEMIKNNTWMEDKTKSKALEKLDKINWKIGYPNKWKNFDNLSLNNLTSISECLAKINEWWFYDEAKELYCPTDLEKWEMLPHQVNAYYHPLLNEIVFPAAILQEPFFNINNTLPENYGGIGVVIAHEITHGFDDEGNKFDADGNLNNWWTKNDRDRFDKEVCKLEKQFNNLELFDTKLNGKLTLGENLADLGGVRISLAALDKKLKGISINQKKEFFESFAKIWANLCTVEEGQKLIKTDPHSPGEYRVNGILPHLDEFHETYQIRSGDMMYIARNERCQIWSL